MKRNKHHGLNVEFDGLCMDFGHVRDVYKRQMEGDPYRLIEGMMLAAYAVRAQHGYIYVLSLIHI